MNSETLLIGNEHEKRRIPLCCILYIQTDDYLSTFFLKNHKKFVCSKSLREIKKNLPDFFFQINRAEIINLNEIDHFTRSTKCIVLTDTTEHSLSIRRVRDFNHALTSKNISFTR